MTTAIIIHYSHPDMTAHLVRALRTFCSSSVGGIIVVSNGAPEPYETVSDELLMHLGAGLGYAAACNAGAAQAADAAVGADAAGGAGTLLFLNNDLVVDCDFVAPLAAALAAENGIGAAGPALYFPDGRYQLSSGSAPALRAEYREKIRQQQMQAGSGTLYDRAVAEASVQRDVDWLTGAVLMVRRDVFDAIGGFDAGYPFYFEDADICRRILEHGARVVYVPSSRVVHICGGSGGQQRPPIVRAYRLGQLRYYSRHNPRSSFLVLKGVLLGKLVRAALRRQMPAPELRRLALRVITFPFRISRNQQENAP